MAKHNQLGKAGEDFACRYLTDKGFSIVHRNWRSGHKEIDIVALDGEWLVFVEVKTRTRHTEANDAISWNKIRLLQTAGENYISYYKVEREARFDVLILTLHGDSFDVEHIKEAF